MRIALVLCMIACGSSADSQKPSGKPAECVSATCDVACTTGDPVACARAAELYFDGKAGHAFDPTKSFALAKRSCDAGNAFGCSLLGLHYQDGLGTEWAPAKAVAVYEKACTAHEGVGCYNLASMYLGGHGIDPDPAKGAELNKLAATYWETACRGDSPRWCTNLAYVYGQDRGKLAQVIELDQRACDAGVLVGCTEALREQVGTGKLAMTTVLDELAKLCTKGEPFACTMAGSTLIVGDGGSADPKRGIELLKRGCENGDRSSCEYVGMEYASGKNVPQDFEATTRYANMACDRGLATSCLAIADDLREHRDLAKAATYARRACQMGDGGACARVARAFQLGEGVAASEPESERFTIEACRMGHLLSCGVLVQHDRDLPVPLDIKKRLYTDACAGGVKAGCARLEKLR